MLLSPFQVKICGVNSAQSAAAVSRSGADAVGLNFVVSSSRFLDQGKAAETLAQLQPHLARVGVFVNESADSIEDRIVSCELAFVQLHGDEPAELLRDISRPVIRAFRIEDSRLEPVESFLADCERLDVGPRAILLDAYVSGSFGGTGKVLPWAQLANWRARLGAEIALVLAGGLNPENVGEAIRIVAPSAVDTASGVESSPGLKDPERSRQFVVEAKAAFDDPTVKQLRT